MSAFRYTRGMHSPTLLWSVSFCYILLSLPSCCLLYCMVVTANIKLWGFQVIEYCAVTLNNTDHKVLFVLETLSWSLYCVHMSNSHTRSFMLQNVNLKYFLFFEVQIVIGVCVYFLGKMYTLPKWSNYCFFRPTFPPSFNELGAKVWLDKGEERKTFQEKC